MVTATLDDGFGFGLEVIHEWADALGLDVHRLGLLAPPERILAVCAARRPALLGLTVLQLDSEDALVDLGRHLPPPTVLVAGGPVFRALPDLAARANVGLVARHAGDFVRFLRPRARLTHRVSGVR
jgi:methylmalonyl-CoA mutase cobalamin-binding subunit